MNKYRLYQAILPSVVLLGISSTVVYAKIDSCPIPASLQFDKTNHQWKTLISGWKSNSVAHYSKNFNVADVSVLRLASVKIKTNPKGNSAECIYDVANGEQVIFVKEALNNTPLNSSFAEIMPYDKMAWDNKDLKNEFVCNPSTNACTFNETTLPPLYPAQVGIKFAPGTAFLSYTCAFNPYAGEVCLGPFYAGNTYYIININNKFCLEVNRFAGLSWGHYYFKVEDNYNGDPIEVWGASVNPKFSLPNGIKLYKTDVSRDFTLCHPPWSNET